MSAARSAESRDGALEVRVGDSRIRRLVDPLLFTAALLGALWQVSRVEALWPFVTALLAAWVALRYRQPCCEGITLEGDRIRVRRADVEQRGVIEGRPVLSALAVEIPVRWDTGGAARLVVWRDATSDASFRRLSRRLRSCG